MEQTRLKHRIGSLQLNELIKLLKLSLYFIKLITKRSRIIIVGLVAISNNIIMGPVRGHLHVPLLSLDRLPQQ